MLTLSLSVYDHCFIDGLSSHDTLEVITFYDRVQCDQSGRFLNVLGNIFSYKSTPGSSLNWPLCIKSFEHNTSVAHNTHIANIYKRKFKY